MSHTLAIPTASAHTCSTEYKERNIERVEDHRAQHHVAPQRARRGGVQNAALTRQKVCQDGAAEVVDSTEMSQWRRSRKIKSVLPNQQRPLLPPQPSRG